ncbi:MAG: hypothetical protein K9L28_01360 [Synergistales bacterium]|nr:hypothetical protein [Synergistales bacterium]
MWGWVRPLLQAYRVRGVPLRIRLLPCPFASGSERPVLQGITDAPVEGPEGFVSFLAAPGRAISGVVQLGGDLLVGRWIAGRCGVPLCCYTYGYKKGLQRCTQVFTAYATMAQWLAGRGVRAEVAGDLVRDALACDEGPPPWKEPDAWRVVFFPGSRADIRRASLPYLGETASRLRARREAVEIATLLSPFSAREEWRRWDAEGLNPTASGTGRVLEGADLAVTQPGTNTLELMQSGVPFVVAVPERFFAMIPLPGVAGFLTGLPMIGAPLRRRALDRIRRRGYVAWPNRIAGEPLVPEMVGAVEPEDLARAVAALLDVPERMRRVRTRFAELRRDASTGSDGPAAMIAERTKEMVM